MSWNYVEQNIVHSCYGSIQWWRLLISKLLNFCLHLGSRKATCTSGRQSKLKTSSATMVKRMLQVQWFSCTSKNTALEKSIRESTFDWFWFDDWFNRCSSTEYWGLFQCTFVGKFSNILKSCNVKNGWMDLMGRGGWIAAKCYEFTWRCETKHYDSNLWIHTLNLGILQFYLKFQVVGFRKKLLQIECTFFFVACFDCFESLERTMTGATFIFTGVLQNKPDVSRSCT